MSTPLTLTSGLPMGKIILVTLPTGRAWWLETAEFEVRAHVRAEAKLDSTLLLDLGAYLTVSKDDVDTMRIVLSMDGAETLAVTKSGYYDIIMSDPGVDDARAKRILDGPFTVDSIITAAEDPAP